MTLLETLSPRKPPAFGLLVGGTPQSGRGPALELLSRHDASVIGQVASASPEDVADAYARAAEAGPAWAAMPPSQ
jgi:acyl-CoA reductase-like NAD-dependent aldehyde dehydrogenase